MAVLVQPLYDTLMPGWIYLVVNGAVVVFAGLVRLIAILSIVPVARAGIGLAGRPTDGEPR